MNSYIARTVFSVALVLTPTVAHSAGNQGPPVPLAVIEAFATDKPQPFTTGGVVVDNRITPQVSDVSPKPGFRWVVVRISFSIPADNPDDYFHVKTTDVTLFGSTDGQYEPYFWARYHDDTGNIMGEAWSDTVISLGFKKAPTAQTLSMIFLVDEGQLAKCNLRFFDKIVPVQVARK